MSFSAPDSPRRRSARHRVHEVVWVLPPWAPAAMLATVVVALALSFSAGFVVGGHRRPLEGSPSAPRTTDSATPVPEPVPSPAAPVPEPGPVPVASTRSSTLSAAADEVPDPRVAYDEPGAPPPSETSSRGVAAELREPPAGRYGVQVGAYPTLRRARAIQARIDPAFGPRFIVPVRLAGKGTWYRVRVGAWETRRMAEDAAARLAPGRDGSMVVRYP